MRREYGWTRAFVVAGVTGVAVALLCRAILTGLFVTLVTNNLGIVVLFNLCLSVVLGRAIFDALDTEPRTRRRVVGPRPGWARTTSRRRRDRWRRRRWQWRTRRAGRRQWQTRRRTGPDKRTEMRASGRRRSN